MQMNLCRHQALGLLFGAMLALTLWFPSTREAQRLCLRWLVNWRGHTFVQGQPSGCVQYVIPNVQFTTEYAQELRQHSTNSLADYARATASGAYEGLEFPAMDPTWKNSPLLPWIAWQMAWQSAFAASTNTLNPALFNMRLPVIHLAELTDSNNGAFWLAEADLQFAAQHSESALEALWTAASRTNWDAGSTKAYLGLSQTFQLAGLSELDAAMEANGKDLFVDGVVGQNKHSIESMMVQAVSHNQPEEFARLVQLLVQLRRPNWSDYSMAVKNGFRGFNPDNELIKSMAVSLKYNLATNWLDLEYGTRKSLCQQVFQAYLQHYVDPVTVASFNAQTEASQIEVKLRERIDDEQMHDILWRDLFTELSGTLAYLMLSLLCAALLFDSFAWYLNRQSLPPRKWPWQAKIWAPAALAIIFSTLIFAKFEHLLGVGYTIGFPAEPPPLVSPALTRLCFALCVFCPLMFLVIHEWKSGRLKIKPLEIPALFGIGYLLCLLPMAFFRHQLVAEIISHYQ
jgi:hypothetical protein